MMTEEDLRVIRLIPTDIFDVLKRNFGFETLTPVQRVSVKNLIEYNDVIVQAPTGSGKTLAYVLPVFVLLRRTKKEWPKNEIGALILVPTRELANQVSDVCRPFVDAMGITLGTLVGGKKAKNSQQKNDQTRSTVVVATPGRFQKVIEAEGMKKALKTIELLVVDEADRFIELGFKKRTRSFVGEKRRSELMKQLKEVQPQRNISSDSEAKTDWIILSDSSKGNRGSGLIWTEIVKADEKLCALVEFIRNQQDAKILVFFSTCSCVEYMKKVLTFVLFKRKILSLHGKKKNGRESDLDTFRKTPKTVMFSTDVMSRGIDVADIDWVIQFDIPKQSSWFVHRSGRSGRSGREGKSLLLLSTEQEAYVQFLQKYEKVTLETMRIPTSNAVKAEQLRAKVTKMALNDRDILEHGTEAFVSFIESYVRHDCNIVCSLQDLDVAGYAHAYGLLRLPRMKEFRNRDLSAFKRSEIDTSTIRYRKKSREKQRQAKLEKRKEEKQSEAEKVGEREQKATSDEPLPPLLTKKRKRQQAAKEKKEWEELADDAALLKKFKKGRLGKKELVEAFIC